VGAGKKEGDARTLCDFLNAAMHDLSTISGERRLQFNVWIVECRIPSGVCFHVYFLASSSQLLISAPYSPNDDTRWRSYMLLLSTAVLCYDDNNCEIVGSLSHTSRRGNVSCTLHQGLICNLARSGRWGFTSHLGHKTCRRSSGMRNTNRKFMR
jgi:hypothetical protein